MSNVICRLMICLLVVCNIAIWATEGYTQTLGELQKFKDWEIGVSKKLHSRLRSGKKGGCLLQIELHNMKDGVNTIELDPKKIRLIDTAGRSFTAIEGGIGGGVPIG